ncbi:MAG TPA: SRPBCC family protein [Pyrinomonadaceae bacterium]|nr:SRPBCC family protein [Pyrinomonadaceae bacterium]
MDTWEVTFEDHNRQNAGNGHSNNSRVNVGQVERLISGIGGGALLGYAITNRTKTGIALGLLGAGLLYRGATGQCEAYRSLGINTAKDDSEDVARDVHVEKSITVNSTPKELFRFWRNFENLPLFMEDLESVTKLDETRSHWVANGPGGQPVEWDAEIYNERENELIAWRSLPGSDVTNAGSVHFEESPGHGTFVKVVLNYNPPGGRAASLIAKLFGKEPGQLIEHNLRRFKQLIETGEIPTTEGQTSGREQKTEVTGNRKQNKLASKTPVDNLARAAREGVA